MLLEDFKIFQCHLCVFMFSGALLQYIVKSQKYLILYNSSLKTKHIQTQHCYPKPLHRLNNFIVFISLWTFVFGWFIETANNVLQSCGGDVDFSQQAVVLAWLMIYFRACHYIPAGQRHRNYQLKSLYSRVVTFWMLCHRVKVLNGQKKNRLRCWEIYNISVIAYLAM